MRQVFLLLLATIINSVDFSFALAQPTEPNEALHLLMRAYQNGGFNPLLLNSGTAEFERNRTVEIDSEKLESLRQIAARSLKNRLANDEKKPAGTQSLISDKKKVSSNGNQRSRIRILFLGNDRNNDDNPGEHYKRLYDTTNYISATDKWVHTVRLAYGSFLRRPSDPPNSRLSIEWMSDKRLLWLKNQDHTEGEFQVFGRLQEDLFSLILLRIQQKTDRRTFTYLPGTEDSIVAEIISKGLSLSVTGEVNYDSDAKAKVIEVKKGDQLLEKYHIDVERGYLCPYQFVTNETGEYVSERTASDFIKEKSTGLFYPQKYRERSELENVNIISDFTLVPDTLQFNQRVSEKEFAIDIPENSRVKDSRGSEINYVAVKNGTISLAKGGYDLPNLSWLVCEERLEDYVPSSGGTSGYIRWLLMSSGAIMVLVALYLKWQKRLA